MTDDQVYFLLWCSFIAIVLGGCCLVEHVIYWMQDRWRWMNWFNWQ